MHGDTMGNVIFVKNMKGKFIARHLGDFIEWEPDDFFLQAVVIAYLKKASTELRIPMYAVQ
jgi:hypothetical protein